MNAAGIFKLDRRGILEVKTLLLWVQANTDGGDGQLLYLASCQVSLSCCTAWHTITIILLIQARNLGSCTHNSVKINSIYCMRARSTLFPRDLCTRAVIVVVEVGYAEIVFPLPCFFFFAISSSAKLSSISCPGILPSNPIRVSCRQAFLPVKIKISFLSWLRSCSEFESKLLFQLMHSTQVSFAARAASHTSVFTKKGFREECKSPI